MSHGITSSLEAQQKAANPAASIWVEASAGSGKTKVLTDRFINIMLDGTHPERILCLTFTKAAAAEMSQRIIEKVGRWASLDDTQLKLELQGQRGCVPTAADCALARNLFSKVLDAGGRLKVQTLHSFCQTLLRRFPLESGLVPHFTVLDEGQAHKLLAKAKNEMLSHPKTSAQFLSDMTLLMRVMDEMRFDDHIKAFLGQRLRLLHLLTEVDHDLQLLKKRQYALLNVPFLLSEQDIMDETMRVLQDNAAYLESLGESLKTGGAGDQKCGVYLCDREHFSYMRLIDVFLTKEGTPRKRLVSAALDKKHPELMDALQEQAAWLEGREDLRKRALIASVSAAFLEVGYALLHQYQALKDERCLLDYEDLIIKTYQLLRRSDAAPWVLYKLEGGIDHILIDEAQDTSPEQWSVIQALSEEFFDRSFDRDKQRTLFVVGDSKQSIYSFQGADPKAFRAMGDTFQAKANETLVPWSCLDLDVCFRSAPEILEVVDGVFGGITQPGSKQVAHIPFREGHVGWVDVWPIIVDHTKEHYAPWTIDSDGGHQHKTPSARLARQMAGYIKQLLEQGLWLPSQSRTLEPRDILILLRKRSQLMYDIIDALKQMELPVAGVDRLVLVDHLAIKDLLAFGHFLLLPDDDLTLACLLKSPLFEWDEEMLFDLCHNRGPKSLWQTLSAKHAGREAWTKTFEQLRGWLGRVDYESPYHIYAALLDNGGRVQLDAYFSAQVHELLDEFLSLALAHTSHGTSSLQLFLDDLQNNQTAIKRESSKDEANQMRVMTVHGAKGLQAPVVFLPDTTQLPAGSGSFLWTEGAAKTFLWRPCAQEDVALTVKLKEEERKKSIEEYQRLLYVALTRAEDGLCVMGYQSAGAAKEGSWYSHVARTVGTCGTSYIFKELAYDAGHTWQGSGYLFGAQEFKKVCAAQASPVDYFALPSWLDRAICTNTVSIVQPSMSQEASLMKEKRADQSMDRRTLGVHIHKLLQHRCTQETVTHYSKQHGLNAAESVVIADVVYSVQSAPELQFLFGPKAQAEVPLMGIVDGKWVSAQVDVLVVDANDVCVIDFKTTPDVPASSAAIPKSVQQQMAYYKALLTQAFPTKTIRVGLVYTHHARLLWLG